MLTKRHCIFFILNAAVLVTLILVMLYGFTFGDKDNALSRSLDVGDFRMTLYNLTSNNVDTSNILSKVILQRNEISRKLNKMQQKMGQMECERLKQTPGPSVVSTGAWCEKESKEKGGGHLTDKALANELTNLFEGKYVASFGDGPGRYKLIVEDSGRTRGYDAYDGAPFCDVTSENRVQYLDLTLEQFGLPLYDFVMSLEVAEHIPVQHESVYLDNIVRHAKEGVVISWAKPGQPGLKHINNKPFDYVKAKMESFGFTHDVQKSDQLKKAAKFYWLKANTNVFIRTTTNQSELDALKLFV